MKLVKEVYKPLFFCPNNLNIHQQVFACQVNDVSLDIERADMARDLRKEMRKPAYKRFAKFISKMPFGKEYANYDKCYSMLGAMVRFRCKRGCRSGGGPPFCKIRKCCQKKGYEGCWECDEFETCKKLDFLKEVHLDGHIKNLRIIRKKGMEEFIKGKRNW